MFKYLLILITQLIISNPIKCIFIMAAIVSFYFAGKVPPVESGYRIVANATIDGDQFLIAVDGDVQSPSMQYSVVLYNTDKVYPKTIEIERPMLSLKNNRIIKYEFNGVNALLWIIFTILCIIITILFFMDDDTGWGIDDARQLAIRKSTKCEEEDGKYYYTILDRLVHVDNNLITQNALSSYVCIKSYSDILFYPKFMTKQQKREAKLKKIVG